MEHIGRGVLLPASGGGLGGELLAEARRACPLLAASPGTRQRAGAQASSAGLRELARCYQPPCLEIAPMPSARPSALRVPDAPAPPEPPRAPPAEPPATAGQAAPGADSVQVSLSAQRESFVMQTMRQGHYGGAEGFRLAPVPSCPQMPGPGRDGRRTPGPSARPWTTGPRPSAPLEPPEEPPGRVQFRDAGGPQTPPCAAVQPGPGGDQADPQRLSEFSDFGNELLAGLERGPGDGEDRPVCSAPWVAVPDLLEDDSERSEFYRFIEGELARLPQPAPEPALPDSSLSLDALPVHATPRARQIIEPTPAVPEERAPPLQPRDARSFSSAPATPGRSDSVSADITESLLVEGRPLPDRPAPEDSQAAPAGDGAGYSDEGFDSSGPAADPLASGRGSVLLDEVEALIAEAGPGEAEADPPRSPAGELTGSADLDEQDLLGSVGGDLEELLRDSGDGSASLSLGSSGLCPE